MTLGEKIKRLRVEKKLTQKDLADKVYVTFQTVSKWEKDENEPDVNTLKQLAKVFDCSLDYLLSEDEAVQKPVPQAVNNVTAPVEKTVVIHQKEMHVCTRCKKDISEGELAIDDVCVRRAGRGHPAEYRKDYYHKNCLDEVNKERAALEAKQKLEATKKAKKVCFGWSIPSGIAAFVIALVVFLVNQLFNPGISILLSLLIGYAIFAMIYCILSGSYIGEVFTWCAGLSVRFPGLIFSWDLDGFIWLITMKLLFAVLGFLIGVFALLFAIVFSAVLGAISFPFILIHNNHTGYEDFLF